MKESYREGLASRTGPESYAGDGNIAGVALTRGTRRPAIELRYHHIPCADAVPVDGRQYRVCRQGETRLNTAESENLCMRENSKRENREILLVSVRQGGLSPVGRNGRRMFQTVMPT